MGWKISLQIWYASPPAKYSCQDKSLKAGERQRVKVEAGTQKDLDPSEFDSLPTTSSEWAKDTLTSHWVFHVSKHTPLSAVVQQHSSVTPSSLHSGSCEDVSAATRRLTQVTTSTLHYTTLHTKSTQESSSVHGRLLQKSSMLLLLFFFLKLVHTASERSDWAGITDSCASYYLGVKCWF